MESRIATAGRQSVPAYSYLRGELIEAFGLEPGCPVDEIVAKGRILAGQYTQDLAEVETRRSFARLIRSRLGMPDDASDADVLGKIHDHLVVIEHVKRIVTRPCTEPTATIHPDEMCPGDSSGKDGSCDVCGDHWRIMPILPTDDGELLGDEGEVRVCSCGKPWVAVRCSACREEFDRYVKGDEDYEHAADVAREESVSR